ncbi:MAG TPA: bifunctional DNA-formamidopyrimidine glycosylase/DNA-(apurinic or apyrimidinic site) lyase [Gemmatimonadales bacterium]|nr:bifunctional DNA-formamidopyrimidine glycosylase/DNA-(apurinic or apyrimidinic site) lyase [Gemmatimonadales bacterium]
MPELPEVETMVRDLAPRLEGCRIARVQLRKTDVLRQVRKSRLITTLIGNTIEQVGRRAKHAVFRLSSGHRLIIQPRMTGSFLIHERPLTRSELKYAVLLCTLSDGRIFVYRDVRRLGTVLLLDEDGWIAYTARIGPEPLEETFTPFVFADRLKGTRTAVKKAIMDQRRLAGVGNIYANEALFDARLDPSKPTHRLSLDEFARLHAAIVDVLERALASSGTTVRDYRTATGEPGRFQFELRVYGRAGDKCVTCGSRLIATHAIDLRQTVFCRKCQAVRRTFSERAGAASGPGLPQRQRRST